MSRPSSSEGEEVAPGLEDSEGFGGPGLVPFLHRPGIFCGEGVPIAGAFASRDRASKAATSTSAAASRLSRCPVPSRFLLPRIISSTGLV
jgi:hypothetical protein